MKSIAAAIRLAKAVDDELEVIWFQDWGLGCRFDQLFKPLGIDRVTLREANNIDLWTRDIPRKKNFYIPWIAERLHYQATMDRIKASKAFYEGFDFVSWARGRNVWLASDVYFIAQDIPDDAFDIFHPVDHLQERIRSYNDRAAHLTTAERRTVASLEKALAECLAYNDILHDVADRQMEIDLDDGVAVNYPKFAGVLAKIK